MAPIWALIALLLSSLACANPGPEDGPLWTDASELRFDLAHPELSVEIHNRSGLGRAVTDFTLGGDDWDTLRFIDDNLPRTIPAHGSVVVPISISTAAFRSQPGVYRSGSATLGFRSTAYDYEVPIRFVPPEAARPRPGPALALLALWTALLAGLGYAALLRRSGPSPRTRNVAGVAAGLAALLTAAATLPLGYGWCTGRAAHAVGPRELAQCRAWLGGHPLEAFSASPSLVWIFVGLALVAVSRASLRSHSTPPESAVRELALAGVRLLTLVLLVAALGYGLAPAEGSLTGLLVVQTATTTLGQVVLPRWGALAQPLGFGLALLALTSLTPASDDDTPLEQLFRRAERVLWSGLVATLYLGGPALPWLSLRPAPLLTHGPQVALEVLALATKTALLVWASTTLHQALERPERQTLRWLVPLALVHLAAVLVWAVA